MSRSNKTLKRSCMKKSFDDWYPCYDDNMVKLSLIIRKKNTAEYRMYQNTTLYRVSVWGEDDFGMEKDFDSGNQEKDIADAIALYELLEKELTICLGHLKHLGFVTA